MIQIVFPTLLTLLTRQLANARVQLKILGIKPVSLLVLALFVNLLLMIVILRMVNLVFDFFLKVNVLILALLLSYL